MDELQKLNTDLIAISDKYFSTNIWDPRLTGELEIHVLLYVTSQRYVVAVFFFCYASNRPTCLQDRIHTN